MKKRLATLVVAAMAISGLAGCGSGNASGEGEVGSDSAIKTEERVKEATLELYASKGKNTDYVEKAADLYNKKFGTELKIKPVDVGSGTPMVQKVTPKLIAKEAMPDILYIQSAAAASILDRFSKSFYSAEEFGFLEKFQDKYSPAQLGTLKNLDPDKKLVGFPNDWGSVLMYFNRDVFEKAGVDPQSIENWDQLLEAGVTIKEKTGVDLFTIDENGEAILIEYLTQLQGGSFFDKNGNITIVNEKVEKAYEIIAKARQLKIVKEGALADFNKNSQECALLFSGAWFNSVQQTEFPDDSGKWGVRQIPQITGTEGKSPVQIGSSWYVPKKAKNAAAAMQFLEFMLTDKEAIDIYLELDGMPANSDAANSELAKKEFPYYGDEQLLQVAYQANENLNEIYLFAYYTDMQNYIQAASSAVNKGEDVTKALQDQAEQFASKYSIKVIEE